MPAEGPGKRYSVPFTKQTVHGAPAVENAHAGVAAKSAQAAPAAVSVANATAAQLIGVGEEAVIMLDGLHEIVSSLLPSGAAVGNDRAASALYIRHSDNALVLAATALSGGILQSGFSKFGLLSAVDSLLGRASVNLNLRSAF